MSTVLICHVIKARRPPETGNSGAIFEDSLLNSLGITAGERTTFRASRSLIEESRMLAAGLLHVNQTTNETGVELGL